MGRLTLHYIGGNLPGEWQKKLSERSDEYDPGRAVKTSIIGNAVLTSAVSGFITNPAAGICFGISEGLFERQARSMVSVKRDPEASFFPNDNPDIRRTFEHGKEPVGFPVFEIPHGLNTIRNYIIVPDKTF